MLWEKKVWMSSAFLCDTSSKCDTIPLHSDFCGPWHPRRWNICGCKPARRSGSPWPVVSWMKFQVWSVLLHSGFGMIQAHTWVIYQQIYVEINTIDTYLFICGSPHINNIPAYIIMAYRYICPFTYLPIVTIVWTQMWLHPGLTGSKLMQPWQASCWCWRWKFYYDPCASNWESLRLMFSKSTLSSIVVKGFIHNCAHSPK